MAGHSQFANIMYRKGAQDKKRAKLFSKLAREITVAAKLGAPEPDQNPRLRSAIIAARAQNMPKDNIARAIKKSEPGSGESYDEVRYEGFGPGGVALIIEGLTDNRNRTASEVRSAMQKHGGNMGASGSVAHQFEHCGAVTYLAEAASADDMFEAALEAGATDCEFDAETGHAIFCDVAELHQVRAALEERFGEATSAKLVWKPQMSVELGADQAETLLKMLEALDDNDDVQNVYGNYEIPDDIFAKLTS